MAGDGRFVIAYEDTVTESIKFQEYAANGVPIELQQQYDINHSFEDNPDIVINTKFDINARFNRRSMGINRVTDFASGIDTVVLDRTTFTRLRGTVLRTANFASVGNLQQARNSNALFTDIRSSGALYYNENRVIAGFGTGG